MESLTITLLKYPSNKVITLFLTLACEYEGQIMSLGEKQNLEYPVWYSFFPCTIYTGETGGRRAGK